MAIIKQNKKIKVGEMKKYIKTHFKKMHHEFYHYFDSLGYLVIK